MNLFKYATALMGMGSMPFANAETCSSNGVDYGDSGHRKTLKPEDNRILFERKGGSACPCSYVSYNLMCSFFSTAFEPRQRQISNALLTLYRLKRNVCTMILLTE